MARRHRGVPGKQHHGFAGHGNIPEAPTDGLVGKKPLGPIGKVGKKGFGVSKTVSAKKFSKSL